MEKKALIIGNDNYKFTSKLRGAVNDANAIAQLLKKNADDSPNFDICLERNITNATIKEQLSKYFSRKCDHFVIYFAGHGIKFNGVGYLCGIDAYSQDVGIEMSWISEQINRCKTPEITLIFDCCFAGEMFNVADIKSDHSILRQGVTLLAATTRDDLSVETNDQRGLFTSIIENGLNGAAADIRGEITAASLYRQAEQLLSPFQQRPVFKSTVTQNSPIRKSNALLEDGKLRLLCKEPLFKEKETVVHVNPEILNKKSADLDIDYATYQLLYAYSQGGLLQFEKTKTLLDETMAWGTCRLSNYGKLIWDLLDQNRI